MDTHDVQEKLQKAYKSMLDHVEELVDNDKLSLKEAFHEAEEKLSELRELSREEIQEISDDLKIHISELGESANSVNESLRETLSSEKAYITDKIWNSLSKVADQTKVELEELKETLQMNMATDASSFSDQQKIWFDEAQQWQKNYETALQQLDELRNGVRKQLRKTYNYSKTISASQVDQEAHDLQAQISQEISSSVNELYEKLIGEAS